MIGLVFFGKKSKHIEKMEEERSSIFMKHQYPCGFHMVFLAVLTIGIRYYWIICRRRIASPTFDILS